MNITDSYSFEFRAKDVKNKKSSFGDFLGFDFDVTTINYFLVATGVVDILFDTAVFIYLLFMDGSTHIWAAIISSFVILIDLIQLVIPLFDAPLGVRSVKFEKYVLLGTGIMDIFYETGLIILHIVIGIWYNNDELVIGTAVFGGIVQFLNIVSVYYTLVDYEKDHWDDDADQKKPKKKN